MSQPFGLVYADAYDLIYRDKDYGAECALIEHIKHTATLHVVFSIWAVEQVIMLFR